MVQLTVKFSEKEHALLKQISKEFELPLSKLLKIATLDKYFEDWNDENKIRLAADIKKNIKDLLNYFLFNEEVSHEN